MRVKIKNLAMRYKLLNKRETKVFSNGVDHVLIITKSDYNDCVLYYVTLEDAYRTPEVEILTKEELYRKYKIDYESQG